ncbi:hypothetical protein [Spiroplasma ixodetis]|uniref:Uncharacterized protein n=1 Tax=Spiroplasma ixodetis TaxID=2141 RepID=A0ABN7BTQ4_9MOLU
MVNYKKYFLEILSNDDNVNLENDYELIQKIEKYLNINLEEIKSFNNLENEQQELVLQNIILLGTNILKMKIDIFDQETEDKDFSTRLENSIYFLNDWNFSIIDLVVLQKNKDLFNLLIKLELNKNDKKEKNV